jgi:hypothetical protein
VVDNQNGGASDRLSLQFGREVYALVGGGGDFKSESPMTPEALEALEVEGVAWSDVLRRAA